METELNDLATRWAAAELHGDVEFLARTLTEDFTGVGPRGFMLTREQWLGRYRSGDLKNQAFELSDITVRIYGDAAILIGRQTQQATHQGRDAGGRFRATLVFVRQDGAWLLAGLQLSPLMEG